MKKIFFQLILLISGLTCLYIFLLPLHMYGIFNIGNITGTIVSLILVVYAVYMKRIHRLIGKIWSKTPGKFFLSTAFLCIISIIVLVIVETSLMVNAARRTPANDSTLIVLGCKVYGTTPSLMLQERLDAAYNYLIENPEAKCIVSGGQGSDESISEAECMYLYLVEKGIDANRIYKEDKSTSTRENLAFSKEIIEANNLSTNIAIATNDFHQYRAGKIAKTLELSYGSVPGKTNQFLLPAYYVRELYGILYEWIF